MVSRLLKVEKPRAPSPRRLDGASVAVFARKKSVHQIYPIADSGHVSVTHASVRAGSPLMRSTSQGKTLTLEARI